MSRQGRWLFLFCFLAFVVGLMFGLRFAVTYQGAFRQVKYVPVPVRDTLASSHWYLRSWPPGNRDYETEFNGEEWVYVWPLPSSSSP